MRDLLSRVSPLLYLLVIFACSGLILLGFGALSLLLPGPAHSSEPLPPPISQITLGLPNTPTAVPPSPSPPPVIAQATQTPSLPPTPAPSPTEHYVVPVNPTPKPTPELPPAAAFPESCDGPGRMNILLIGVDGRSTNYARAARADAIAVLGVNFTDKTAQLLSLPRDLWVQVADDPNRSGQVVEQRINTAFAWGQFNGYPGAGPGLLEQTIANNLGLRIDRFVAVNFYAFEDAVDAIGGIDIEVPKAIHDTAYPARGGGTMVVDISAGWIHMDGPTALIYARTRHQDSDFGRMKRQQAVMMAFRDKLLSPEVLPHLPGLTQLLLNSVYTDLNLGDIGLLGCVGPRIQRESVRQLVVDQSMTQPFVTTEGAQVLLPRMDVILPLLVDFNTGE